VFVCMYVCACACAHEIKRQGQCTRMHAVTMHSLTLLALERGREGERERGREGERERGREGVTQFLSRTRMRSDFA